MPVAEAILEGRVRLWEWNLFLQPFLESNSMLLHRCRDKRSSDNSTMDMPAGADVDTDVGGWLPRKGSTGEA